jgi:hypothetical protein
MGFKKRNSRAEIKKAEICLFMLFLGIFWGFTPQKGLIWGR